MRVRRVGNEIRAAAVVSIAPDVVEVKPVPDLVCRGAAEETVALVEAVMRGDVRVPKRT